MQRALRQIADHIAHQRDQSFLWAPIGVACGIALYFSLKFEPAFAASAGLLVASLGLLLGQRWLPYGVRACLVAAALVGAGFGIAGVRAHMVAEPVLGFRYYGPIEGRVVVIDRSGSDAVRLTLDRVVLSRMDQRRTPDRVRISLHAEQGYITPEPGQTVILTGHLSPPSGPVEPGGFNFQRMAWFQGLGAVGYTRVPVLLARPAEDGAGGLWIYRLRVSISQGVLDRLGPRTGSFAAAILTGDRSNIPQDDLEALRASNLAHLLAISGMHMGILASFIFGVVRYGLALVPAVALRWPTKKIAAVTALAAAAFYLALSGGNVATQRAFVMVAVMLVAVLFDRRALTLRAVAIAALIVLTLRPEALFGPGFQMSFAATTALVAVFSRLRYVETQMVPKWLRPFSAVFISSLVAGLATAPIAAFHFNQVAQYGLIANLLSVPLMGVLVMPAAVLAAVLYPIGLEGVGLWFMGAGLDWILGVAHVITGFEGSLRHVVTPQPWVLVSIAMGGVLAVVWRGPARWVGVVPIIMGFAAWQVADRPDLLVADSGSLIGVMTPQGRDVSKERGESFAAGSWLENDGGPVPQEQAYARDGLIEDGRIVWAVLGDTRVVNVRGKTALEALGGCGGADVLITNQEASFTGCQVYDINRLRKTGALAGWVEEGQLRLESVQDRAGARLWNSRTVQRRATPLDRVLAWGD
ncbi:ComEC/Rec2 family competence protein [Pseudooctadecabacter jejudonensis]|uniref:ComEC family competence protein n=1 Tax=Pseudooctadecabacter jejudonensis TaxID=1391910 RepID=A0A1Y5RA98_9RHOB|nr:ComEC/Rec2 family competence protein [Pseudooctadecabacter jejudonensis]SLN12792.1 ComEC family competence protein [Pseudooctadecabacter jejudonensis]